MASTTLIAGDDLGYVKLVNVKSKTLAATLGARVRSAAVAALCWVPTAGGGGGGGGEATSTARVATLSRAGELKVWDTATGASLHRAARCGADAVLLAAWRGAFVSVSRDGNVRVWPQGGADGEVGAGVEASGGGGGGGGGCGGASARVFSVGAGVCAAALHPSGVLLVGGRELEPATWDLATGLRTWAARAVAPDKLDLRVPVWNAAVVFLPESGAGAASGAGADAAASGGASGGAGAVAAAPVGGAPALSATRFAVATGHRALRFYDARVGVRPLSAVADIGDFPFTALALSRDGQWLISGDAAGIMRRFDARTFAAAGVFRGHTGAVRALAVHASLPYVASASLDRTVRVFHVDSRQLLRRLYLKQRLAAVLFAPGGAALKTADGALPGSGLGMRQEAHAAALARAPDAEDAEEDAGGEGGEARAGAGGGGGADEEDDGVWQELERRRLAAAAEAAAGSKRAAAAAPAAAGKRARAAPKK